MKKHVKRKFRRSGKFWVYILECKGGAYYTGYTNDLEKRIKLHNQGLGSKYTRMNSPVRLVWKKEYRKFRSAFKTEILIKQLTRLHKETLVKGRKLDKVLADAGIRRRKRKIVSRPG